MRSADSRTPPFGIIVFGSLFILSSLIHMKTLLYWQWYWEIYQDLPQWLRVCRYSLSWTQRILGISAGIGLLCRKDLARKVLIGLGIFTILGLPWKHPYQGFVRHTAILDQRWGDVLLEVTGDPNFTFSSLTVASMICHWILDFLFWAIFFFYVTRPHVKRYFQL